MNSYESDASGSDEASETSTNVVLGYASNIPTHDTFSQLGGHPLWLSSKTLPPAYLATCTVCNSYMSLLLQLNCDLPDHFPGHERRLYVWACRRPPCKRKYGSVKAFRASRVTVTTQAEKKVQATKEEIKHQPDIGSALFGVKGSPMPSGNTNPFTMPTPQGHSSGIAANPFSNAPAALASLAAKPPQRPDLETDDKPADLPESFAQKARISSSTPTAAPPVESQTRIDPWPPESSFPSPYAKHHLEDEPEYLYPTTTKASSSNTQYRNLMDTDASASEAPTKDEPDTYESPHDTAFQHFADRLAQNPEQVLRYDFGGQPLLYSKTDAVGALFASQPAQSDAHGARVATSRRHDRAPVPACASCASPRGFELQLTPHAIALLEDELDPGAALREGMEWGTILVGTCGADCVPPGTAGGEVGYVEEWVGVQWEETVVRR